jgi:hypothetical protein
MTEDRSKELKGRRDELTQSLATLERQRTDSYRVNCDAIALERYGVTDHGADKMQQLREAESGADLAYRDAQHELREIDSELDDAPGGGDLGARFGRIMRRVRGSE